MALKLFILGLPGSGKSSVARYISMYAKDRQLSITHVNDYDILYRMFLEDTQGQFKRAAYDGFDVLDLVVFDIALNKLEQKVNQYLLYAKQEELVLIEFARNDYRRAFQQFSDRFVHDAYFLYLDVETEICKKRVQERISNPSSEDDFFVSEYIFSTYYTENKGRFIPQILASDYDIDEQRVMVIDNNGSLSDSIAQVYQFVDTICGLEPLQDS